MKNTSIERSKKNSYLNNEESFNEPELRFPEFNGIWEEYYLGDICTFSKGKGISKNDITETGIDCIRYGELYTKYNEMIDKTCSKTNLPIDNLVLSEVNDVIIPSTGETAIDISQASCIKRNNVAIGGDINILKSKEDGVFLSYYLNSIRTDIAKLAQGISVIHLYSDQLKILKVNIPSIEEQKRISDLFISLDKKIELMEKKISINNMIRHYYINHFYTKNEQNFVPLGNFIKQLSTKNKENEEYEVLSINNKKGFVKQKDQFGEHEVASSDKHNYKIINYGNYAYNPARINVGSIARLEEFDNGIISPMYIMFDIKNEELSSDYLKFYFDSETFKYNMLKRLEGSVRQTLSFDALKNIPIYVPNYEMQEKTSKFLKVYDQEINLLQRKIMTNKKFKQTLLSKMFC